MNRLLVKQDVNYQITKQAFFEDIDCLFEVLQDSYGLYEYFGHETFTEAKAKLIQNLDTTEFEMNDAISLLKSVFSSFIKDGHFTIGPSESKTHDPDFAVRYTTFHGIPMIQCGKFYADTPAEEAELEQFSASFPEYQNGEPLIIDVRDNPGGSDIYIWNFIKGLFGAEPDYPCIYVQKYSPLFREFAQLEERGTETVESDGVTIKSNKQIYVLMNEKTSSSGESAVAYLKTVENTVIVGTHTAGRFTCGNCMTIYLPNSHLPVYFGTGMVLYEKTRNMDAEGGFRGDISYKEFLKQINKNT